MRSYLFVPGDSDRKLAKAGSAGADALILDLEDSVAAGSKEAARNLVSDFLKDHTGEADSLPIYVRINSAQNANHEADVALAVRGNAKGIVLPKAKSVKDVEDLDSRIKALQSDGAPSGDLDVVVMVSETPQSVLQMASYADGPKRTAGLAWGGEDFAAAVGAKDNRDENGQYTDPYRLARTLTLLAAASGGMQAIDAVFTDFRDMDGLKAESLAAARDGFTGKLAIHPAQVEVINDAFTPSDDDISEAKKVVAAFSAEDNIGVLGLDNKMLDLPNLLIAQNVLERARLAGKAV